MLKKRSQSWKHLNNDSFFFLALPARFLSTVWEREIYRKNTSGVLCSCMLINCCKWEFYTFHINSIVIQDSLKQIYIGLWWCSMQFCSQEFRLWLKSDIESQGELDAVPSFSCLAHSYHIVGKYIYMFRLRTEVPLAKVEWQDGESHRMVRWEV